MMFTSMEFCEAVKLIRLFISSSSQKNFLIICGFMAVTNFIAAVQSNYLQIMRLYMLILVIMSVKVAMCQPQYMDISDDPCFYNASIHVRNVANCIQRVKTAAADSRHFWFGDTWKSTCHVPPRSLSHWIKCYNPSSLQRYTSLGSRLLRVGSFNLDFLRNLDIFPEVTFHSPAGKYSGCDHTFGWWQKGETQALPLMSPTPPWLLRLQPRISWPGQIPNVFYTIVMLDVGFGGLNYLAYNYPYDITVAKEYTGPSNFREEPNPYAVVLLRQPQGRMTHLQWHSAQEVDASFNLQTFMIDNQFQQSLVGLNWVTVGTDAYAIQLHKTNNLVDNCPALIRNRLYSQLPGRSIAFLPESDIENIDTWMSISYNYRGTSFTVCCDSHYIQPGKVIVDPIGDGIVLPVASRDPPIISVSQSLPPDIYNYRRTSRQFVALMDSSLYTIMLVTSETSDSRLSTPDLPLVLWLVTNIPGSSLQSFTQGNSGTTVLPYRSPMPNEPGRKVTYMFILMQQTSGMITDYDSDLYTTKNCPHEVKQRCRFDIVSLMARNGLRVKGISWFISQADEYVMSHLNTITGDNDSSHKLICSKFGLKYEHTCKPLADFSRDDSPRKEWIPASHTSSISRNKTLFSFCSFYLILKTLW